MRAAVLVTLGLIAVSFTRDEPLGNRVFLWSMAALIFAVAVWGVFETWRELKRLRRQGLVRPSRHVVDGPVKSDDRGPDS